MDRRVPTTPRLRRAVQYWRAEALAKSGKPGNDESSGRHIAPPAHHEDIAMSSFRRDFITKPIFSWARGVLPSMSDTEREALEAGDI